MNQDPYTHLSKEAVLAGLEKLGKDLKGKASPNYWAAEDTHRAAGFVQPLEATRAAYARILKGEEPVKTLLTLNRDAGFNGEPNFVNLMISALKGQFCQPSKTEKSYWITEGGHLWFIFYNGMKELKY
jgi:hypothetical protein